MHHANAVQMVVVYRVNTLANSLLNSCQSGRWRRDSAATGKLSYYSGQWGSYANFGKHAFCALTTHEANGDRGTGWYLSQEQGNWHMRYYNLSAWGVTCFD